MLPEVNKSVGARLRAFRDSLQIPRSRFAVSIGYGSERIASYESGRAPLPYQVFRAVSARYHINPHWLATGRGNPLTSGPIQDEVYAHAIAPRACFVEVYDRFLASVAAAQEMEAKLAVMQMIEALAKTGTHFQDPSLREPLREEWSKLRDRLEDLLREMNSAKIISGRVNASLRRQESGRAGRKPKDK